MTSDGFEQNVKQRISELEVEKRDAERRLQLAHEVVKDKEQRLLHWFGALQDYRESNGLPTNGIDHSQVMADEYATLGPTEMVGHWATRHSGNVVVKEVVAAALRAGAYTKYRTAYNSIRATLKRHKGYQQIGVGHFVRGGQVLGT